MSSNKDLLSRRVAKILPDQKALQERLEKGRLRLYIGVDPTGSKLHLGHTIGLKKLMEFADAGHEAILLFGTGTVLVGDPSLRNEARKVIDQAQIDENIKTWKQQVSPIINFDKVKIKQNGDWLTKLGLKEIVHIASNISAVQLFKRQSFTRRIAAGNTVWYHETMYPLLQGYDSVEMDVDLEIGGTDQEFNMLVGRELQRKINNREKYVLEVPMILGPDGEQMSKTRGNCVWLDDSPNEMFGKLMTTLDEQIVDYLTLLTNLDPDEISKIESDLKSGMNPRDAKFIMAEAITEIWHGKSEASQAKQAFINTFSKKQVEDLAIELLVKEKNLNVIELIKATSKVSSNSAARALLDQNGVRLNKQTLNQGSKLNLQTGDFLEVGKKNIYKIRISKG